MAKQEKPVVGKKKGQADLFLFDPGTGHRGHIELKRRRKDGGIDALRKEQIENAAAYEEVYGVGPRVYRYLEYAGEKADNDDHPFMCLTYDQDRIYASIEAVREVFEKTAVVTEAGNRVYREEYCSGKREDSEEQALSDENHPREILARLPPSRSKYAVLDELEIGQSVVIDVPRSSCLSKVISKRQKKTGKLFTRRMVEGGVRVWRIDPTVTATGHAFKVEDNVPFERWPHKGSNGARKP